MLAQVVQQRAVVLQRAIGVEVRGPETLHLLACVVEAARRHGRGRSLRWPRPTVRVDVPRRPGPARGAPRASSGATRGPAMVAWACSTTRRCAVAAIAASSAWFVKRSASAASSRSASSRATRVTTASRAVCTSCSAAPAERAVRRPPSSCAVARARTLRELRSTTGAGTVDPVGQLGETLTCGAVRLLGGLGLPDRVEQRGRLGRRGVEPGPGDCSTCPDSPSRRACVARSVVAAIEPFDELLDTVVFDGRGTGAVGGVLRDIGRVGGALGDRRDERVERGLVDDLGRHRNHRQRSDRVRSGVAVDLFPPLDRLVAQLLQLALGGRERGLLGRWPAGRGARRRARTSRSRRGS